MPAEVLLNRGQVVAAAINAAANNDNDVFCQGHIALTVRVEMTGAAAGDLSVQLNPYENDGVTVEPIAISPVTSTGPTLNTGKCYYFASFDVSAMDKCRLRITNNNAGAQTINRADWKLD